MFWRSVKIPFFLCFGAGDGHLGVLCTVLPCRMRAGSGVQVIVFSPTAEAVPLPVSSHSAVLK